TRHVCLCYLGRAHAGTFPCTRSRRQEAAVVCGCKRPTDFWFGIQCSSLTPRCQQRSAAGSDRLLLVVHVCACAADSVQSNSQAGTRSLAALEEWRGQDRALLATRLFKEDRYQ